MRSYRPALWITIIFVVLSFFPKSVMGWDREKYQELQNSYIERNNRLNLALGERVYDKSFNRIFDAIIIGMPDTGYTVKNMEKSSGYIFAEGKYEMPPDQFIRMVEEMRQEIRNVSGFKIKNDIIYEAREVDAVSISLLSFGNQQTKVKIRIKTDAPNTYPPYLEEIYKSVWRAIERQVFLDENLDGNDKSEPASVKISPKEISRKH